MSTTVLRAQEKEKLFRNTIEMLKETLAASEQALADEREKREQAEIVLTEEREKWQTRTDFYWQRQYNQQADSFKKDYTCLGKVLEHEKGMREQAEAQAAVMRDCLGNLVGRIDNGEDCFEELDPPQGFLGKTIHPSCMEYVEACEMLDKTETAASTLLAEHKRDKETIASLKRQLQAMRNCSNCEKAKSQFSSCPLCKDLTMKEWEPDKKVIIAGKITDDNEGFVESINAQGRELLSNIAERT